MSQYTRKVKHIPILNLRKVNGKQPVLSQSSKINKPFCLLGPNSVRNELRSNSPVYLPKSSRERPPESEIRLRRLQGLNRKKLLFPQLKNIIKEGH